MNTLVLVGIFLAVAGVLGFLYYFAWPKFQTYRSVVANRARIKQLYEEGLASGSSRAVLTYQNTKVRPDGIQGGTYYPTHSVVHIAKDARKNLDDLLASPKDMDHFALHIIPEGAQFNTNSYMFECKSPVVDRPLTLDETILTMSDKVPF